jgi:hypothetical protein
MLLDLSHNALSGALPRKWVASCHNGCCCFAVMTAHNWHVTRLSSVPATLLLLCLWLTILHLQALMLLDLSHNALSGALPREWGGLSALSYLYLNANNLTLDELPCEWGHGMLSLKLADVSGNRVLPRSVAAAAAAEVGPGGVVGAGVESVSCRGSSGGFDGGREASDSGSSSDCSSSGARLSSSSSSSSSRMLLQADTGRADSMVDQIPSANSSSGNGSYYSSVGSSVAGSKFGGRLDAPRCWLRRFCYDEGAFVCLQRHPKHPAGGCTSYVYGASDLHIDAGNQVGVGWMGGSAAAEFLLAG